MLVTKCCSDSRMIFRTSRGALEWPGGKDLYMESCFQGSGKSFNFFGVVPGNFQKVLETSGGVQKSTKGSTTSQGLAWAEGRRPGLIGPGAHKSLKGPCSRERWKVHLCVKGKEED